MMPDTNSSRCWSGQHRPGAAFSSATLGSLADIPIDAASPVDVHGWEELTMDGEGDGCDRPSDLITKMLSDTSGPTTCLDGNSTILPEQGSDDGYHMKTPFKAVSSISKIARWQKRPLQYKEDHIQQKKGRRQRNLVAISLLTIPLPPELRRSSIRPLNEAIRKLTWWEKRESINEDQRRHLCAYREIQREWQKLLRA